MISSINTEPYKIRCAKPSDAEQVKSLLQVNGLPIVGIDQYLQNFLVADKQGSILGALGAHYDGKKTLLRSFVVNDCQRSKGIGRSLLKKMLEKMVSGGVDEVFLLTETAASYFIRLDFIEICRDDMPQMLLLESGLDQACPCSSRCLKYRL